MSSKICSGAGITTPSDVLGLAAPIDGTLRQVIDEASTGSALYISTGGVKSDGTFESTGAATLDSIVCTEGATFGGGFGSSGVTVSTAGAISADALGTFSVTSATNAECLRLYNPDEPASGETTQTAQLSFYLDGSTDSGSSFVAHEAARIEAYKVNDFFGSDETDFDSGLKFYVTANGTETLAATLSDALKLTVEGIAYGDAFYGNGDATFRLRNTGLQLADTLDIFWSSDATPYGASDLNLSRHPSTANTLCIDDGGGDGQGDGHLLCTNIDCDNIDIGGGYGSPGCTISAAGTIQCDGGITAGSSLTVGSSLATYGQAYSYNNASLASLGAGMGVATVGYFQTVSSKITFDYADLSTAGLTKDVTICTLRAKTALQAAYLIIDTVPVGVATFTLSVDNDGAGGQQVLVTTADQIGGAVNTVFGDADGEVGTDLDSATAMSNKLYSYTATQALTVRATSTVQNLDQLSAGAWTVVLIYTVLP